MQLGGIDGIADMRTGVDTTREIYFQVKSGAVSPSDVNAFIGVVDNAGAAAGIFITLEAPTKGMLQAAAAAGTFTNPLTNQTISRMQIVEVRDIMAGAVMSIPMTCEVLKRSPRKAKNQQTTMRL
jgi:site-specific DNA-methyltransferase (adenine-specific)